MINLLLTSIVKYIHGNYKKVRDSDGKNSVVIYQVTNNQNVQFTRIDIFRGK